MARQIRIRRKKRLCFAVVMILLLPAQGVVSAAPKPKPTPSPKPSPSPSNTAPIILSAPFTDGDSRWRCTRSAVTQLNEVCWTKGHGHASSGDLWSHAELESPLSGKGPQVLANKAESVSEILADTTLPVSTGSVPVYATFEVHGADASLTGAAVSRSQVSGGITLAYNGQGATSKALVDSDPTTDTPATFAGRTVLATTIPPAAGGSLSITAGTSGSATVAEGDVANARVDVIATLESIQIGGTAPSPDPTTPPTSTATYTAPFGGTAEAWSQRNDVRTNWNWEDASGASFDAQSGDVGFQFDAVGLSRAGHGWYEGEARFTLEHGGIARGSTVTVKVVWEMTTATSFHTPCVVFDDCNFAGTGAYMCLERPDGEPLSSWEESCAEGGLFFDDGESGTQTDGRLELVVTVPDVTSDSIVIETVAESILRTLGGYGEFEFDGRLKSVTVEQS